MKTLACVLTWSLVSTSLFANSLTWNGSLSGYWSSSGNWTPASGPVVGPGNGDVLTFPGTTPNDTPTNNVPNLQLDVIYIGGNNTWLSGNQITLTNGFHCSQNGGDSIVDLTVVLGSDQYYSVSGSPATSSPQFWFYHNTRLNGHDLELWASTSNAQLRVHAPIQETGNLSIRGPGTVVLGGENTFSGTTTVKSGTLELSAPSGNAIPGDLIIGDGVGATESDVVRLTTSTVIGHVPVTVNSSGLLDLNGNSDGFDTLALTNGRVRTGTGFVSFQSVTTSGGGPFGPVIDGNVDLGSLQVPFDVTSVSGFGELVVFASMSGTGGITKNGTGLLSLGGTNTYSGATIVNAGTLKIGSFSGAAGGSGTVINGGTLQIIGSQHNEWLTNNSNSSALDIYNSAAWSSNIVLNADLNVNVPSPETSALSGVISGAGGLIKTDTGTLRLSGSSGNTYTGTTTVNEGTLELQKSSGDAIAGPLIIGDAVGGPNADVVRSLTSTVIGAAPIYIRRSGLLDLNGFSDGVGALTLNGGDVATAAGTLTLSDNLTNLASPRMATISGNLNLGGVNCTFDVSDGSPSPDLSVTAAISNGGITKTGDGILLLSGNSSYSAPTYVDKGVLSVAHNNALGSSSYSTVVTNAGTLHLVNGVVLPEPLMLGGAGFGGTNGALVADDNATINGSITLVAPATIRADGNLFLLPGVIDGTGDLTKVGDGSLMFGGVNANTYLGHTYINEGAVLLNKGGQVAIPNHVTVGSSQPNPPSTTLLYTSGSSYAVLGNFIVNKNGLLNLNGQSESFTLLGVPLTLNSGGNVATGSGLMTLPCGSSVVVEPGASGASTISGRLGLAANNPFCSEHYFAVNAATSPSGPELTVSATLEAITGTARVIKTGSGEMRLTGNNTYTGQLSVGGGKVTLASSTATGAPGGGVSVNSNAMLVIDGSLAIENEPLTINSTAPVQFQALSGASYWNSTITLNQNTLLDTAAGASLDIYYGLGGTGSLTKTGPGALAMLGSVGSTNTNSVTITAGTLYLDATASVNPINGPLIIGDGIGGADADTVRLLRRRQIANTVPVTINSSGLLDTGGYDESFGALSGNGHLELGPGASAFEVNYPDATSTFNGVISGQGNFYLHSTGTLTLNGNNTYTGLTILYAATPAEGGKLIVNGSQPQSPVIISNGCTLGGNGTVGSITVPNGAMVAPGNSTGILTCGNATFSSGSTFAVELNGTNPGTGYDQLAAGSIVNLGNATLNATLGFASAASNTFTIINKAIAVPVTGTFQGLPQNAVFNISGIPFRISYTGGTGNDVVLTQLLPPPTLASVQVTSSSLRFSWPSNYTGFTLESKTNLTAGLWTIVTPPPVLSGTNYVVTNAVTDPQRFYRLRAP